MPWLVLLLACAQDRGPSDGASSTPPTGSTQPQPTTPPVPTTTTTTTTPTSPPGLVLTVDPAMDLMIDATWPDPGSDSSWLEYRFEGDEWLIAPILAPGSAVILGVPALTSVEARAATEVGGVTSYTESETVVTGDLPPQLLLPRITTYDAALASTEAYGMISVSTGNFTFEGPYWIEIFDRAGRVVWFHQVPNSLFSFYPSVSRDGTHIWFEAEDIFGLASGGPFVTRQTLDGRWTVSYPVPDLGQAIAEGPDDSFFFEHRAPPRYQLQQIDANGLISLVWDCGDGMADIGEDPGLCPMNTCNWDETRNTVLVSEFESSTVFEIDVATGQPIRQFGQLAAGDPYAFDPPTSNFAYQHDPYWTPEGTLFVSTHIPCHAGDPGCSGNAGRDGIQLAAEYTVDDVNKTLTRIWSYESTDRWATQAGEAYRLPNGNHIQGYGQDGAVREVTPDGQVAWEAAWAPDGSGYRMVGHFSLIGDLYALNVGQ